MHTFFKLSLKKSPNKDFNISWAFIWRFLAITIAPVILAIFPTIVVGKFIFSNPPDTDIITALIVIFYAFFLGICLSLFGSILPAASLKSEASFSSAFKRGKSKFWKTLWALFYGPFAISALNAIVPMVLVLPFIGIAEGTAFMSIAEGTPSYKALEYGIEFIGALVSAFATILVATILSQLYLETEEVSQQA